MVTLPASHCRARLGPRGCGVAGCPLSAPQCEWLTPRLPLVPDCTPGSPLRRAAHHDRRCRRLPVCSSSWYAPTGPRPRACAAAATRRVCGPCASQNSKLLQAVTWHDLVHSGHDLVHSGHDHRAWTTQLQDEQTAKQMFDVFDTDGDGRLIPPPAVKQRA